MKISKLLLWSVIDFLLSHRLLRSSESANLLRLQLLVLSHITPCECYMCSYFRTISCFSLHSHTHFCCNPKHIPFVIAKFFYYIKVCISLLYGRWGVHLTIRTFWVQPNLHHPVFLAIGTLHHKTPIFRFKMFPDNLNSTNSCGTRTIYTRIISTFLC